MLWILEKNKKDLKPKLYLGDKMKKCDARDQRGLSVRAIFTKVFIYFFI